MVLRMRQIVVVVVNIYIVCAIAPFSGRQKTSYFGLLTFFLRSKLFALKGVFDDRSVHQYHILYTLWAFSWIGTLAPSTTDLQNYCGARKCSSLRNRRHAPNPSGFVKSLTDSRFKTTTIHQRTRPWSRKDAPQQLLMEPRVMAQRFPLLLMS